MHEMVETRFQLADLAAFEAVRPIGFETDILRNTGSLADLVKLQSNTQLGCMAVAYLNLLEVVYHDTRVTVLQYAGQPLGRHFVQVAWKLPLAARIGAILRRSCVVSHFFTVVPVSDTSQCDTSRRT